MDENSKSPVNNAGANETFYVAQGTPPTKPPPALETGVLAWVRENLFSSLTNTALTFVGGAIAIASIISFITWTVQDANWFAITFNFRGFMIGRYEAPYEWRTTLTTLIVVFVLGAAAAIWLRRISRTLLISIIVILLVIWGLPTIVKSLYDLPPLYSGAGEATIEQGTVVEDTIPQVAFLGKEGEVVTIRFANAPIQSEETLSDLVGFQDAVANTLKNAANDRLTTIAELDEYETLLEQDSQSVVPLLTMSQRSAYENLLETTEIPAPIIDQYEINQISVRVDILDGDTGESIASAQILEEPTDSAQYVLPHDGWFILDKVDVNASGGAVTETEQEAEETNPLDVRGVTTIRPPETTETAEEEVVESASGLALLSIHGIYPILQSTSYVPELNTFQDTFIRMTDRYSTLDPIPEVANEPYPFFNVIRNQYRGERPFADYLRVYVTPFLERISFHTTVVLMLGVLGYAATIILHSVTSKQRTTQIVSYALISLPVIIWLLVNGMYAVTMLFWLVLLGVGMLAFILNRIGQVRGFAEWRLQKGIPVAPLLTILGTLVVYALLLRTEGGGVPSLLLWFTPLILAGAALAGASIETMDDELLQGAGFWLPLIAAVVIGGVALAITQLNLVDLNAEWFLEPSDPRMWGGFLLTIMLTIYGIIIAFPIGVGLALGRRSDLPAIKYLCTAYIELVRGSPFITVLFFMQLLIPLISSELAEVPNSYRALVATIAFSAAYLAENVRGGLQSLPPGQGEAAKALGLSPWQATLLITLPQALRAVIPALVGQFIGLYKDTSLVAIVGLIDLTGFVNTMVVQAEFIGTRSEGLFFISVIYFVFSYLMSYISRLLEASGSGSARRNTV